MAMSLSYDEDFVTKICRVCVDNAPRIIIVFW